MAQITITPDSTANDLIELAMCIHSLFGNLPVTARSKNKPGLRIEDGAVISRDYTGPILEQCLAEKKLIKTVPASGIYKDIPVIVAPILVGGEAIAAVGVVDATGSLEIKSMMDQYMKVYKQVGGRE
ncbi:hypothetical protein CUJ83_07465 [Methanocella sp. CWC-04]|uniref:DUF2111 domain-containing protein n=1 Tax=Methanooceanicella nereidis TaxID=2052831 RepID=A0AAP2REY2_9EURY|nr:DUF2111 domain-containing protein [Methanocella sp. CWC-04]MCD1294835.1 hypothetical protein [Methanocella sp. CWC-04]